jgi:hypothetical protein
MPTETDPEREWERDERLLAWTIVNSSPATGLERFCYGFIAFLAIAAMVGIAIGWR